MGRAEEEGGLATWRERAAFSCVLRRLWLRDSPMTIFEPEDATRHQMPSTFLENEGECYKNPLLRIEDTLVTFLLISS